MKNEQNNLVIRDLEARDISRCAAIEQESPNARDQERFWANLRHRWNFAAVAELDGAVVGYILCNRRKRELYIETIAVANTAKRRGIGKALMVWVIEQLPVLKKRVIELHVSDINVVARALYIKLGFQEMGPDGKYEDDSQAVQMIYSTPRKRRAASSQAKKAD